MDQQILNIVKNDNDMYNIYKSIVDLENEYKLNPDKFNSVESVLKTILKILENNNINNNVDSRIKKKTFHKIESLGFYIGNREYVYKYLYLCKYLEEFTEKLDSNICIIGCSFGWDSSGILMIACKKVKNKDVYLNIINMKEKLKNYVLENISPNEIYD